MSPNSKWIAFRFSQNEKDDLRHLAAALGLTQVEVVRQGLALRRYEWVRNQGQPADTPRRKAAGAK